LSQQFVDQLCSSDGLADDLLNAIERVIFEAHPPDERLGARSFTELRDIKTQSVRRRKEKYTDALREIGDEISVQDDLRRNIDELTQTSCRSSGHCSHETRPSKTNADRQ